MTVDCKSIAGKVFLEVFSPMPWKLDTPDIATKYSITHSQARRVNKWVKRIASERGLFYGWDPIAEHFRIAPDNNKIIYDRMLNYLFTHYADSGVDIQTQIEGAFAQGLIDKSFRDIAVLNLDNARRFILASTSGLSHT